MSYLLDNPEIRRCVFPISVPQYQQMVAAGFVAENTELLRGVILQKVNKSPLHGWTVRVLRSLLESQLPAGYYIRQEEPLEFGDSEPEPDLCIVAGSHQDHRDEHPATAVLAVEVAITSIELDRAKSDLYAEASIDEYWLVLPLSKCIEVFSSPKNGRYQKTKVVSYNSQLPSDALAGLVVDFSALA